MKPDFLRKYPLVKKFLDQERDMFGAPEPVQRKQLERALELIDREGGGSPEEKQTAMICAALMLNPMSLYADMGRFWEGYNEDVENMVQGMLAIAPGSFLSAPIAQGTVAAGIAQMETVSGQLRADKLSAPPAQTLEGIKQAFGQEMDVFSYLDAPALLSRFENTRNDLFAALEAKIQPVMPPKRPKPGNGSFDF